VGLALDYDIFLLARVEHFRFVEQLDDRTALLAAVGHTGNVITAAGLVMAISFGGLFLSRAPVLNQCACLLVTAVLYDTLVIRTCFMPALISLSRGTAWWPRRVVVPDESSSSRRRRHGDSVQPVVRGGAAPVAIAPPDTTLA